mgnify:CR=1 FL=1
MDACLWTLSETKGDLDITFFDEFEDVFVRNSIIIMIRTLKTFQETTTIIDKMHKNKIFVRNQWTYAPETILSLQDKDFSSVIGQYLKSSMWF